MEMDLAINYCVYPTKIGETLVIALFFFDFIPTYFF